MPELTGDTALRLAERAIAVLRGQAQSVATAESLTAGLCCATLTSVPGASAVVRGGLIVYATDLKGSLAGVPDDLLREHGPVSERTAYYLAAGARERLGADWGISLTGVAGPDMQDGHPVGEVWLGIASSTTIRTRLVPCHGDRAAIRSQAVEGALRLLLEQVESCAREQSPKRVR